MNLAILYDGSRSILQLQSLASITLLHADQLARLHEFDALWIRATACALDFALAAKHLNMPVLNSYEALWNTRSKLIQHEYFIKHKINYPLSQIITNRNRHWLGYPAVYKTPDASFKINNRHMYNQVIRPLFAQHSHLIAQDYLPTEFDWCIVILDTIALYAAKTYSDFATHRVPLSAVSSPILTLAQRAARVFGKGLFSVRIKDYRNDLYVLSVSANPIIPDDLQIYKAVCDYLYTETVDNSVNN